MAQFSYTPKGVCSRKIEFDIVDGKLTNVEFLGGCNGNTQGLSLLTQGMDAQEVVNRLKGVKCGFRSTSCPDQLAQAIEEALKKE